MSTSWLGIGPGQILTPNDVDQALLRLLATLDRATDAVEQAEDDASKAGLAYDVAFARALVASTASNESKRKAEALLACEALLRVKVEADTIRLTRRERMKALLTQIDIVRSLGASVRGALSNAGGI